MSKFESAFLEHVLYFKQDGQANLPQNILVLCEVFLSI